jgi:hypothetical protein
VTTLIERIDQSCAPARSGAGHMPVGFSMWFSIAIRACGSHIFE